MPSFAIPKPLPGSKKSFPSVSARVNSFGDRKAVSKLPAPGASAAAEKPLNGSQSANVSQDQQKVRTHHDSSGVSACLKSANPQKEGVKSKVPAQKPVIAKARAPLKNTSRVDVDVDVRSPPGDIVRQPFRANPVPVSTYQPPKDRSTVKKDTQQPAKKGAAKSPLPEKVKLVPFRARPVPASTYKPSFQPTVRKINVPVIEKEQAPVEVVNEPTIVDDVEVDEPIHEPASCEPPEVDEPNGINEDVCCPTGSVDEPVEASIVTEGARSFLPPHPQGPDIPPFLPMVFIKDCIRPYAPQQWDNYTGAPDYGNLRDTNGTYFWDRSMDNYHCIRMPQECFYQHFPEHRVGDGALPPFEHNGTNEDVTCPAESVHEPAEASIVTEGARALLPPHPQGPDIPPFLPMVFIKDCIRPYAPQQWDNYTGAPDYGNLRDANGTYFWDRSMDNYHCIRMPQECFYQHFPEHRVGDGAMPQSDVQGNGNHSANVRVRNVRKKKKPHKAEWNASYQRRLARRAKERAERVAREQQAAPTEVPENTDSTNVSEAADGNLDASVVVDQIPVSIEEVGLPEPTCDPVVEEHLPIYIQQESVVVSSVRFRSVDGTAEVVADGRVRVRGRRGRGGKKKPHKALWNKSYQRRLARRAKERAERAAMEAQKEAAEAAVPQVPQ